MKYAEIPIVKVLAANRKSCLVRLDIDELYEEVWIPKKVIQGNTDKLTRGDREPLKVATWFLDKKHIPY